MNYDDGARASETKLQAVCSGRCHVMCERLRVVGLFAMRFVIAPVVFTIFPRGGGIILIAFVLFALFWGDKKMTGETDVNEAPANATNIAHG